MTIISIRGISGDFKNGWLKLLLRAKTIKKAYSLKEVQNIPIGVLIDNQFFRLPKHLNFIN